MDIYYHYYPLFALNVLLVVYAGSTPADSLEMENLRNFVVIKFHDGLEIVNKHWKIDENNYYFPSGVKDRLEYFKLINTMVSPGYKNEKYVWSPRSVVKVHSSDEEFEEAVTKLEMKRMFGSGIDKKNEKDSVRMEQHGRDENILQFAMSPTSSISTSGDGRDARFPMCEPFCGYNTKLKTNNHRFEYLADGYSSNDIADHKPTQDTCTPTAMVDLTTMVFDSETSSDSPIKTSPFGFSSKVSKDDDVGTSQSANSSIGDNKKYHVLEYFAIDLNSKLTKVLANQEQIISLINRQLKKKSCDAKRSMLVGMFTDELEDYFTSKFPLKSMDDVNESENMLFRPPYYKYIKSKLLSFVGSNNLYFATKIMLTKLLTNRVATRITFFDAAANQKCDKRISSTDTEYTVNFENLMLYTLILDVIMTSFDCDEEQINVPIRGWLEHAKDRQDRREYLKSKANSCA